MKESISTMAPFVLIVFVLALLTAGVVRSIQPEPEAIEINNEYDANEIGYFNCVVYKDDPLGDLHNCHEEYRKWFERIILLSK